MQITRERAVELLNENDLNKDLNFLFEYCKFHQKDENLINLFLQIIFKKGLLKSFVIDAVYKLVEKNNISLNKIIDLRTNTILKVY
jgi:hypothetical protein